MSENLLQLRRSVIDRLIAADFSIEQSELQTYHPHLTIRLGVELQGSSLTHAQSVFPVITPITFDKWMLLRLYKDGQNRQMRELLM